MASPIAPIQGSVVSARVSAVNFLAQILQHMTPHGINLAKDPRIHSSNVDCAAASGC